MLLALTTGVSQCGFGEFQGSNRQKISRRLRRRKKGVFGTFGRIQGVPDVPHPQQGFEPPGPTSSQVHIQRAALKPSLSHSKWLRSQTQ